MHSTKLSILVLVCLAALVNAQKKVINSTYVRPASSSTDKVTFKTARSEYPHHGFEHHYPHHFGGGHMGGFGHYKELEHYLFPILVVLGLGVLVMPMLGMLMTTLVGNVPVTTLVSGRKRRDLGITDEMEQTVLDLWGKFEKAIESFRKEE